jgi:hypothetical protein
MITLPPDSLPDLRDVEPMDEWADAIPAKAPPTGSSILPSKRTLATPSHANQPTEAGLRIEPVLNRHQPQAMEVQELSGTVVRLEKAEFSAQKIESIQTFQNYVPLPRKGFNSRGESSSWGESRHFSKRWITGFSLIFSIVLVCCFKLSSYINETQATRANAEQVVTSIVKEEIDGSTVTENLLQKQPEALQIYRSYLQAVHEDQIVPLIQNGHALGETLRKHWKPYSISRTWRPSNECEWNVIKNKDDEHPHAIMSGMLPDSSAFNAYFIYQNDHFLLDWKATTAFSTASFEELSEGGGDSREIRGKITIDSFYTTVWPEAEYQSYKLLPPNPEEASIWCYARRDESTFSAIANILNMNQIIKEEGSPQKVTLRLSRGAENARPNQWLITELIHRDWLTF